MHIHGVVEFILQCLHLGLLVQQLLFFVADFGSEILKGPNLVINGDELISQHGQLHFVFVELLLFLFVVDLPLRQVRVRQLNLLVELG